MWLLTEELGAQPGSLCLWSQAKLAGMRWRELRRQLGVSLH